MACPNLKSKISSLSAIGGHDCPRAADICPRVVDHVCPGEPDMIVREWRTFVREWRTLSAANNCPPADDCPPSIICPRAADNCPRRILSVADYCPRRTLADIGQNFFRRTMADFFWRTVHQLMADPIGSDRIRRGLWRTFCVRIKSA